jgi:hypothetical protein
MAPANARYRRELAYAEGNLCSVALEPPKDPRAALRHCAAALAAMQVVARAMPGDAHVAADLVNRHAWLSDAYVDAGDLSSALEQRQLQQKLLDELLSADPQNMDLKDTWVVLQRAVAGLEYRAGRADAARRRLVTAQRVVAEMIAFDPENQVWRQRQDGLAAGLAYLDRKTQEDRRK